MPSTPRPTLLRAAPAAGLLPALAACSNSGLEAPSPPESSSAASSTSSGSDRNTPVDIRVTLDGRAVEATLNGSPAARDLATLLPLTLDLEDFHGTERIGYPPRKLTTDGAPTPVAARAGDIAYYAPWGNLALFHQDGPAASAISSSSATSMPTPTSCPGPSGSPSRPPPDRPRHSLVRKEAFDVLSSRGPRR
ncbi:cyclophilin-like fold protein [Streptomyces sp. NPDC047515]|uniref:cyclophilin-like fold protein n=1 Tax=Streptomyces sp. NPDC047515 TaxID=3155380 RepID=UPI0033DEF881